MRLDYLDHQTFDKEGYLQEAITTNKGVGVSLSERNLKAFLAKLDGYPKQSIATIGQQTDLGMLWVVAHEGEDEPYMRQENGRGEGSAVVVHVSRKTLNELLAVARRGRVEIKQGADEECLVIAGEADAQHYAGRAGVGEMAGPTEEALRREKLRSVAVGDKVVRMLAGTIPMKLVVSKVDETFIYCGPWKFNRDFGFEVDEDLGEEGSGVVKWDGSVTPVMSYLMVESIEKAKAVDVEPTEREIGG